MKRQFHDIPQNTDKWDQLRLGKITASECKTLFMGKSTKGYLGLVDEKAYNRLFNEPIESKFFGNYSTQRGHDLEPFAVEKYEEETFREVSNGGFYQLGDHLGASPDANIVSLNGGVEVKCFEHAHFEKVLTDPDSFTKETFNQTQFQMYVCGFDFMDIIAYHPNYNFHRVTVKPDLEFVAKLETEIAHFETLVGAEIERKIKLTPMGK